MSNAEAAVGKPGNQVVEYYIVQSFMNFYSSSTVQLTGTSITQDSSGTVMTFTQKLNEGVVPINDSLGHGSLNFIWAIGCSNDNSFSFMHCSKGSVSINLSPCVLSISGGSGGSSGNTTNYGCSGDSSGTGNATNSGGSSGSDDETNSTTTDCTQFRNSFKVAAGSTIQYISTDSIISMYFSTNQKAWLSIGRSSSGKMAGSDAVIGLPSSNSVGYYLMTSGSVSPDFSVNLSNTSIRQTSNGTVLQFTQNLKDGRFSITNSSGSQTFVWAIGCDNVLAYHCSRGSFTLQLSPCRGNSTGSSIATVVATLPKEEYERLVKVHSYLAALAWGLLVPLAVSSSFLRSTFSRFNVNRYGTPRKVQAWFILHRVLNVIACVVTIASFAIIVRTVQRNGGIHFFVNKSYGAAKAHPLFGLLFFLLVIVQVFLGIFRPHVHHPAPSLNTATSGDDHYDAAPPKKTVLRIGWEYLHRGIGLFLLIGSVYQVLSGLHLYSSRLGTSWHNGVLWTYLAFVVLVFVFIVVARSHA